MSGLDLYLTQRSLLAMLAWALVTGFCLGGVYDLLRALRILIGFGREKGSALPLRIVLFGGDVLLAVTASIALILLCYYTNDGALRGHAVWGMAGGFFVYVQTLGRLTLRFESFLSHLLGKLVRNAWRLVRRPIVWVASGFIGLIRQVWRKSLGKVMDKHRARVRAKRQDKETEQQGTTSAMSDPPGGITVFSTRGQV